MKSAKERSGLIPVKSDLFCGLLCNLKQTGEKKKRVRKDEIKIMPKSIKEIRIVLIIHHHTQQPSKAL